jgi:beta-glucosidase-like glycosyl hydrolase
MAASFNRTSWKAKGDVVSTDLRAFNNIGDAMLGAKKNHGLGAGIGTDEYGLLGLTGYGPNINVVKDPRYGRNSELPGEDPVLTAEYAVSYVQGMQQVKAGKGGKPVMKMLSSLKHYTAYSVETSRFTFSANVTDFTLHDSNLPQYQAAFMRGNASGAMCSYFAPNGVSSCGNEYLLNDRIRTAWGRPDAVVMSDCSAVGNMMKNVMKLDQQHASSQAMNAGLDIYGGWGDNLWGQGYLAKAVAAGLTKESAITDSVHRTFMQKMKVGLFDPPEDSPWTDIGLDDINSTYSQGVAYAHSRALSLSLC